MGEAILLQEADTELDELKAKHPSAMRMRVTDGEIALVVRKPTRAEWKSYKALMFDASPMRNAEANEQLALYCVVAPARAGLLALFDEDAGLADAIAKKIVERSKASAKVESGL